GVRLRMQFQHSVRSRILKHEYMTEGNNPRIFKPIRLSKKIFLSQGRKVLVFTHKILQLIKKMVSIYNKKTLILPTKYYKIKFDTKDADTAT
ncbi:MAG TPA: hypothetical protein PKB07_15935, partial [Flavilitoribacter sp.]|nr:hypothetical protein [Flavilitoribacter sp.]